MYKLAVLTSHPIQYQAPLWRLLAADQEIDLSVFFENDFGVRKAGYDVEFGREIRWDIPLLEGYQHQFLQHGGSNLIARLKQKEFDALLVHRWNGLPSWRAVFAAHAAGVKVLLRGENPWNQEAVKPSWKRLAKKVVLAEFFRRVDAFLYIGEENKSLYRHFGVPEAKLFFTPYAIDNDRFARAVSSFAPRRDEFRRALGIMPDTTAFLFAGKLIPKKNPLAILAAYEKIASEKTALLMVGDGELRSAFESAVREKNIPHARVIGFKNQREMPEWYAAADCFVLYSGDGETWGLGINEAMACGLPVIASDRVGSVRDLVRDGENGYVVSLEDVAELTAAMEKMLDRDKRSAMGEHSRSIIQHYSFEADRRGILQALQTILSA